MAQKKSKSPKNSSKSPAAKTAPGSRKQEKNVAPNEKVTENKASVKQEASITESADSKSKMQVRLVKPNFMKFLLYFLLILVTLIVVDLIVQYINNDYSAAIVNGHRISRSDYEKRLEEAYGEVIATQMVNEQLILDKAQEEEVTVTEEEIQALVDDTIEEIGGQEAFEGALEANGLTEEAYRRNLRIQLLAEEMVVPEPSEEDLLTFFEENKEVYFGEDAKYEDVKEEVKDLYKSQKFNENSSAWLSELREEANIQNNITDEPDYGLLKITRNLVSDMNNRLNDEVEDVQEDVVEDAQE